MSAQASRGVGSLSPRARVRAMSRKVQAVVASASVVMHAGAIGLCALVVYQVAHAPHGESSDISVSFDAPGMGMFSPRGASAKTTGEAAIVTGEGGFETSAPLPPDVQGTVLGAANTSLVSALLKLHAETLGRGALGAMEGALAGSSGAFGSSGSFLSGPQGVTFAGLGASTARSVVYAVDCSGPMVTSLPMVLGEVKRSVGRLSPTQKFAVVLFHRGGSGSAIETFAPILVRATPTAQARLDNWLSEVEPSGRSNPLEGLEAALSFKPDAVFLLSRSIERSGGGVWELGMQKTLERLDEINPENGQGRRVNIQTIQFIDEDPSGILQAIGTRHGGGKGYRVIKRGEDLGR